MNKTEIKFCGGVDEVTGANFLLSIFMEGLKQEKILVDCGLIQGSETSKLKNCEPFSYNPREIGLVLVTHAHIDHIGRIPKLVRDGFSGKIISTPETKELAEPLLLDALGLLEEEAREDGVLPIYELADVRKTLSLWSTCSYGETINFSQVLKFVARDAGHILGSAVYEIFVGDFSNGVKEKITKIVFTGDLGNSPSPLLRDTEKITGADYLVMESVYGDRNHEGIFDRREMLKSAIIRAIEKKGTILIPSFSLEKTQVLLSELNFLVESGEIPSVPVFLDSPLAIKVTGIYKKGSKLFNEKARRAILDGDDIFHFPKLLLTETSAESDAIWRVGEPKIIIAGSGMSVGGRITKHERFYLGNPKNTIIFLGYQAAGSAGRQIEEGLGRVKIGKDDVKIKAEIVKISGYSSHKDMKGLIGFVEDSVKTLKKVFVVMGEPKSSFFLANRLRDYFNIEAIHPEEGEVAELK